MMQYTIMYMYIYYGHIYMCVCVCVCGYVLDKVKKNHNRKKVALKVRADVVELAFSPDPSPSIYTSCPLPRVPNRVTHCPRDAAWAMLGLWRSRRFNSCCAAALLPLGRMSPLQKTYSDKP